MRLRTRLLVQIGLALFLTNNLAPGYAAEAHMYRCVNAKGRVYYSDRPGTQCVDGTHDRLTRHGLLLDRPVDEAAARPGQGVYGTRPDPTVAVFVSRIGPLP